MLELETWTATDALGALVAAKMFACQFAAVKVAQRAAFLSGRNPPRGIEVRE